MLDMAYTGRFGQSDDFRREELIRVIEHSVENLTLQELEALYYDMSTKNYINGRSSESRQAYLDGRVVTDEGEANSETRPSVESWSDRWHMIIGTIDQIKLDLPDFQEDKQFIDSVLSVGKYAISHSPDYRNAYHPHYRIVGRNIFEKEIKPLIDRGRK